MIPYVWSPKGPLKSSILATVFLLCELFKVQASDYEDTDSHCYVGPGRSVDTTAPCLDTTCGTFIEWQQKADAADREQYVEYMCGDGRGVCEGWEEHEREFHAGKDGKVLYGQMHCCHGDYCNRPNKTLLEISRQRTRKDYISDSEEDKDDSEETSTANEPGTSSCCTFFLVIIALINLLERPRIRLHAFVPNCDKVLPELTISVEDKALTIESIEALTTTPKLTTCPIRTQEPPGCVYWFYDISALFEEVIPKELTIHRGGSGASMKIDVVPQEYKKGLTAGVSPFFWFNDWPRLFVFIELAQKVGFTHFLFSHQSASLAVMEMLQYYVEKYDSNERTFWGGQIMAENYCGFWSKTNYTALVDVDDLFYPRTGENLIELADRHFLDPRIALKNPTLVEEHRFHKSIFQTKYAATLWTHQPVKFYEGKRSKMVGYKEAVYLHHQKNYETYDNQTQPYEKMADFTFFDQKTLNETLTDMQDILKEIYQHNPKPPKYRVNQVADGAQKINKCPTLGGPCYLHMKNLDEWVYAPPDENSNWIVV
ncbi:unnamed protein product, partial [Mesorhabditis spiculigera]